MTDLNKDPDGSYFSTGHPTHLAMVLVLYSYLLKGVILPLPQDYASIVQTTWQNMKRVFLVSNLP